MLCVLCFRQCHLSVVFLANSPGLRCCLSSIMRTEQEVQNVFLSVSPDELPSTLRCFFQSLICSDGYFCGSYVEFSLTVHVLPRSSTHSQLGGWCDCFWPVACGKWRGSSRHRHTGGQAKPPGFQGSQDSLFLPNTKITCDKNMFNLDLGMYWFKNN